MFGVRLTKYQQIHPDIPPAAQQMFTFVYIFIGAPIGQIGVQSTSIIMKHIACLETLVYKKWLRIYGTFKMNASIHVVLKEY